MNVKIQGGGNGTYANTGSCVAVTNYLQHEDLERMKKGEEVQPFFNQFRDYVSSREVTFKIDNNKAKLSQTDAKFYVITVSPSEKELRCMGRTPQERAEALQWYIRQDVMRNYAEGFGKGLRSDDVEYYAKIHFNRDGDSDSDMHAHIIVSRKDRSNTKKLSPKTNHTGKKNCGNVKGGFDRTDFFRKCESSFDRRMGFDREPEESFDYLNAVKNGSPAEIARQVERAERIRKEKWDNLKAELQSRQEPEKSKIQQVEKTPDIEHHLHTVAVLEGEGRGEDPLLEFMYEDIFQLQTVGVGQRSEKVVGHGSGRDYPLHLDGNRLGLGLPHYHRDAVRAIGLRENQSVGAVLNLAVGDAEHLEAHTCAAVGSHVVVVIVSHMV